MFPLSLHEYSALAPDDPTCAAAGHGPPHQAAEPAQGGEGAQNPRTHAHRRGHLEYAEHVEQALRAAKVKDQEE